MSDASEGRQVLLVAYHFGPGAETGGFRWNAMTEHLAARGWTFDVVTLARDLGNDLPPTLPYAPRIGVRVYPIRRPTWAERGFERTVRLKRRLQARLPGERSRAVVRDVDPGAIKPWRQAQPPGLYPKLMTSLEAGVRVSADALWAARALRRARVLAARNAYRAVVVSSPPHVTHRVGPALTREFGIPYLPDFRDPWIFGRPELFAFNAVERAVGRWLEPRTLAQAHTIICNTPRARDVVMRLDHARGRPAVSLPNGYDALEDRLAPDRDRFRIVFAGSLYPFMDPQPLLAAVRELRAREHLTGDTLRLEFMGTTDAFGAVPLMSLARAYGLSDAFVVHPKSPRAEALAVQQRAAVVVVFGYLHGVSVPAKFYDQAQMRGTMLLIGRTDGALADAARQIGLTVYDPADLAGIAAALAEALRRWRAGDLDRVADHAGVFDRRHQSERLHELLQSVQSGARQPPAGRR